MQKTMVWTFGRMNPPTKAHIKLINDVLLTANSINADHSIFLSYTQNAKTDPIDWDFKNKILKTVCPTANINTDQTIKTPFQALEKIANDNYKHVIFIVGQDRLTEFFNSMTTYATQWGIERFEVVLAGARDNTSNTLEGVSSSKIRTYAKHGLFNEFCNDLPDGLSESLQLEIYTKIREVCKIETHHSAI